MSNYTDYLNKTHNTPSEEPNATYATPVNVETPVTMIGGTKKYLNVCF